MAFALSTGVLTSLLVVRFSGSEPGALAAGALASIATSAVVRRRAFRPDPREWRIASSGNIAIRQGDAIYRDAAVVFVSPAFIVVHAGRRSLEIWRDATPTDAFRRLSVAVRWRARRDPGAALTVINPSDAAERT